MTKKPKKSKKPAKKAKPAKPPKSSDDWLGQATVLSEAMPYMQQYAGETFVIKYGGHAMGDPKLADLFATANLRHIFATTNASQLEWQNSQWP